MYILFYLKSNRASTVCVTHVGEQEFGWRKAQRGMKFRTSTGTKCSLFQAPRMSRRGCSSKRSAEFPALTVISHLLKLPRAHVLSSFSDGDPSGLCWNMIK